MYSNSSRFNLALILGALVLAMVLLSGCVASMHPTPTPVPIATWVAQSVPEDTFIEVRTYDYGSPLIPPPEHKEEWLEALDSSFIVHVDITADGVVTRTGFTAFYTGRISQDELKRVVMKFAEIGFFSISERDNGCVYYVINPPNPSASPMQYHDDDVKITMTIHIHGEKRSINYDKNLLCDERAYRALDELENMIFAIGRMTQKVTPTAVPPTPTPSR
jgi:hypothetical protein